MSRDAPSLPPKDPPLPSTSSPSSSSSSPSHSPQQGSSRWGRWGKVAFDKSIKVSDWAAGYANAGSAKFGAERFFPKSNDFQEELDKCERILRAFTVEGVAAEVKETEVPDGKGSFMKKKRKVLKKIPPSLILRAKGILIYTAMRSGIAPLGGAGGVGLMLARLPDGSWSAPSAITPNNLALGLLLGVDIFDAVLLVNTDRAMESFKSHKVTIGAETAVAAGPFGAGASAEVGVKDRSPVFSYVRSRGLYAGAEAMAQVFLHRFDENERIYYWPGITARDILEGRVRIPPNVGPLHRALRDAETGVAQGDSLEKTIYETVKVPPSLAMKRLASTDSDDLLEDGEKLKLPPTPEELEAMERAGIPDEDDLEIERRELQEKLEAQERERQEIRALPPPPRHPYVVKYWNLHPAPGSRRLAPASSSGSETFAPSPLKHVTFSQVDPAEVELPPSPDLPAQREEEQQEQRLREGAKGVDQEGDEGVDEGELEQVDMHRETSDEVVGVPAIQELELSSLRAEEVSQHGPESSQKSPPIGEVEKEEDTSSHGRVGSKAEVVEVGSTDSDVKIGSLSILDEGEENLLATLAATTPVKGGSEESPPRAGETTADKVEKEGEVEGLCRKTAAGVVNGEVNGLNPSESERSLAPSSASEAGETDFFTDASERDETEEDLSHDFSQTSIETPTIVHHAEKEEEQEERAREAIGQAENLQPLGLPSTPTLAQPASSPILRSLSPDPEGYETPGGRRSLDQASQSPMGRSPIRPSRPPRARPVSAVASGCSSPGTPRASLSKEDPEETRSALPAQGRRGEEDEAACGRRVEGGRRKVVLLLDYDETITREDTLSLISPPPKEEGGGKPFSHYSELYVEELTKLKERFGERESWEREMEYMRELDEEVEWKVTKQIEEGGLFKGERLEDLLERSSKVEFREGWEEFDDWILKREEEEEEEGKVEIETEIISIGWSARFIRESIERGRKRRERSSPSQVPRRIFSNEVEMKPDPLGQDVGTGRLVLSQDAEIPDRFGLGLEETKRKGMRTGLDKLERLNQIVKDRDGLTTIYVGDSRTDLACLLQADYGVLLGDPERTRPIREALVRFGGSERLIELQDVLAGKARKEGGNLLVLSHWNQVLRLVQTLAE